MDGCEVFSFLVFIKNAPNGNGQIWIDGGIKYIAPVLLVHYIEVRNYLPHGSIIENLKVELTYDLSVSKKLIDGPELEGR